MKKVLNNKGVTLVALVVTIIVFLILAAVIINVNLGENGIFQRAKRAKQEYLNAQEQEQEEINAIDARISNISIDNDNLPENTVSTPEGTRVKLPDNWAKETVKYVSTTDGKTVTSVTKVSTVYAVAVGGGETVPVPMNFYYVGGNLNTGVIISDNEADKYASGTDKTTHEYAANLIGNQFVWIPCALNSYKKTTTYTKATSDATWGTKSQNAYYDTSTNSAEKTQIEKYGGFYVGRYEAGTSDLQGISFSTIASSGWRTDATNYNNITDGKVTSKANEIPYNHVDYASAVKAGEAMYSSNSYVSSGILTGTMWDVMINKLNEKTSCSLSSGELWGNYIDKAWTVTRGKYCEVNSIGGHGSWQNVSTSYAKAKDSSVIFSTGAHSDYEKYHIYDVSGNLLEWTQEMAYNNNTEEWFISRGGGFASIYGTRPASARYASITTDTLTDSGFRVALYLK